LPPMKQVYLLTGRPGTGKTTLIKQALTGLETRTGGFYTEEIRSAGIRLGFRLVTLDGQQATLAHIDFSKRNRVGKYGVNIDNLNKIGVPAIHRAAEKSDLIIVDEIGKMELSSSGFRDTVSAIINSGKRVLGTIMLDANPWADAIKRHPQVNLVTVTRNNHQQVLNELRCWLGTENPSIPESLYVNNHWERGRY